MKRMINMLVGALMISAWVVAETYLELKLQRAETWLYIAGILLFLVSAGFCLLMKDIKKAMIISLACAAVMCVLSRGLIWTALPVVLTFWVYRCVTDRLEGKLQTAVPSIVFTASSAVYAVTAVVWSLIAGADGVTPRRYRRLTDIYVAVVLFAALVFLAVICEGRRSRETALLQKKKAKFENRKLSKKYKVRDPIGHREMYIQCAVLFALSIWICCMPGVLGDRYTLRMVLYPWLLFVYMAQCRDRKLLGFLDRIKSRSKWIVGEEVSQQTADEEIETS